MIPQQQQQQQRKTSLKHLVSGPIFIKTLLFVSITSIYQLNLEVKFGKQQVPTHIQGTSGSKPHLDNGHSESQSTKQVSCGLCQGIKSLIWDFAWDSQAIKNITLRRCQGFMRLKSHLF